MVHGPFKTTLELSLEKAKHGQIPQMAPPNQHIKKQHSPFHRSIPKFSCIFWLSLAKSSILPCSTRRRYFRWRHRNGREGHGGSHDGLACKSRSGASVERRWRLFVPLVLKRIGQVVTQVGGVVRKIWTIRFWEVVRSLLASYDDVFRLWFVFQCMIRSPFSKTGGNPSCLTLLYKKNGNWFWWGMQLIECLIQAWIWFCRRLRSQQIFTCYTWQRQRNLCWKQSFVHIVPSGNF